MIIKLYVGREIKVSMPLRAEDYGSAEFAMRLAALQPDLNSRAPAMITATHPNGVTEIIARSRP